MTTGAVAHGGFRADWTPTVEDTLTVQGDYYDGQTGRRNIFGSLTPPSYVGAVDDDAQVAGGNAIVRWSRQLDEDTQWSAQVYYDNTYRHWVTTGVREIRDTVDFDFQHSFSLGERHAVIWGFGYRNTRGAVQGSPFAVDFTRNARAVDLFGFFLQDRMTLQRPVVLHTRFEIRTQRLYSI